MLTRITYTLLFAVLCTSLYWLCRMKRQRSMKMDELVHVLMTFGAIWTGGYVLYQALTYRENTVPPQEFVLWSGVFAFCFMLYSVQKAYLLFRSALATKSKKPRRKDEQGLAVE